MTSSSASPFPTPILSLDRVSKRFAGHTAVDELSLSIPKGVIYGLLGPNGAGKTTTIRMIMDILKPDGGAVRLFGEPGGGRAHSERIGYLPEERGLYRKMRVLDVLVFLGEMKGIDRRRARQRAGEWLERLGLAQWRLRRVDELSEGKQKKVDDYGQFAELELAAGADAQVILQRLVASGARLSRFDLMEPSLNKIFIDLVGPEAARAVMRPEGEAARA